MDEHDEHPPAEVVGHEAGADVGELERASYRVRVPVVFDHLNGDLLDELNRQKLELLQVLGREAAIVEVGGVRFGKFEVWFDVDDDPAPTGRRHAADEAIATIQAALEQVGLAPTGDERGLCVVDRQVITTPLAGGSEHDRR
jgi:hypothetical protein